jgi:amino acid adenylation domain-containing protein
MPIGVPGELCISGHGVTRGYLNRPELTAEKFDQDFQDLHDYQDEKGPASRESYMEKEEGIDKNLLTSLPLYLSTPLYRTGDLARWLPNGNIEFLGRIDHQVKVRGFRIELGEIESQLLSFEEIEEVAVAAIRDHSICAYFTAKKEKTVRELRHFLSLKLPDYMIPAYFVQLEQMPLTPGGKINIKALPEPAEYTRSMGVEYVPPKNRTEKELAAIWQELLGLERVGVEDDFFELGGDSILVNQCIARVREELEVEIPFRQFFERPYIKALGEEIESLERQAMTIPRASRDGEIPLSFAQERLWFLQELDSENVAYFVPRIIRIKGELDIDLLERTFTEILRRHEILRTVFPMVDGSPVQRIQPPYPFKIPVIDWSKEGVESQNQKVSMFLAEEGQRPFDFEKGPLLRVTLLRLKEEEHLLVLTEHHLIHDGWTQGVLLQEFIAVFTAYSEGRAHGLPELPIQYADFAIWQRNYLQGEVLEQHLDYWKEKLSGLAPVLDLPADRPRPSVISGEGALKISHLSPKFGRNLKEFSRGNSATLFMTMLAVFKTFLYRYTGMEDLCVGTGIANRRYKEMEGMLGMVINTLALRTQVTGDMSFRQCLQQVKETCLEAYQHEDTPFGKIVERMNPERSLRHTPVFQVMFSFMDTPTEDLQLPGLELELEESHNRSSKFDINVVVVPPPEHSEHIEGETGPEAGEAGETLVEWEYNTDIFDAPTVDRMISHYNRLLEEIIHNKEETLSALPMLADSEIQQLLYTFNDTVSEYPRDKTIHQLFEEQVEKTGGRVAVISMEHGAWGMEGAGHLEKLHTPCSMLHAITYNELNERSNQMAQVLIEKGAQPDTIVGIMVDRSIQMMVGILGILKAGGAYLPIDPDYPENRIQYMLADSSAKILLTTKNLIERIAFKKEIIFLHNYKESGPEGASFDTLHAPCAMLHASSENSAYVIYTSGTTGEPKGTVVEHRSLVNLCTWHHNYYQVTEKDIAIQYAGIGFDASVWEIFPYLTAGAALHIISSEIRLDIEALNQYFEKHCVTIAFLPTPVCHQFMEQENRSLRKLLTGGDKLQHFSKRNYNLYNNYGPTENTVVTTAYPVIEHMENIPIGQPVSNTQVYILSVSNRAGTGFQSQPVGVPGELCITGESLSRGYLNYPELTNEKFNQDFLDEQDEKEKAEGSQHSSNQFIIHRTNSSFRSLYRTGDLTRWLPDGNIQFLGRIDQQAKIRGFRIELAEIENRLVSHAVVKEAVVLARKDSSGTKYLCAYIIPHPSTAVESLELELSQYLSLQLPDYMIPAFFISLESIPLTPNGKVDKEKLPEPRFWKKSAQYVSPRDEIEKKLVDIWKEVLNTGLHAFEEIGIDDNFFRLGGHSLNATLLAARMHREFNVRVPLTEIFKTPTVKELAVFIRRSGGDRFTSIEPVEKKEYYPLSPGQKRLYILHRMNETTTAYNIPVVMALEGVLHKERLQATFKKIIARHESLRTSFVMVKGEPAQRNHDDVPFEIKYYDEFPGVCPFDLSQAPLLQVGLIKIEEAKSILIVDMHHIITDGTSMGLLVKEFTSLYCDKILSPLTLQYKDYSEWQHSRLQEEAVEKQFSYWQEQFSDDIPVLELPLDFARPTVQRFEGTRTGFELTREDTYLLKELASTEEVTLYTVLLTVFYVFLSKISNSENIIVGTVSAGRRHTDLEQIIGMFVNTLALKNYPKTQKTFEDFLKTVNEKTLEAFENQDYPFEELVEKLPLNRDISRNPLFDVMFIMQNVDIPKVDIPGLKLEPFPYETMTSKFDLTLQAVEEEEKLLLTFEYGTALFKEATIERFKGYFKKIVSAIIERPSFMLSEIEIISADEKQRILEDFNNIKGDYPSDKTIHALFEGQAEKAPDRIAIVGMMSLTYRELNEKSNQLAQVLGEKGVQPDTIVGIMVERSIEMIVGILGILKAGGAYLPIDPGYPKERIRYMLTGSAVQILLTSRDNIPVGTGKQGGLAPLYLPIEDRLAANSEKQPAARNELLQPATSPGNLAYVIYTSGSTGKPKGVMVEHRSVVNVLFALHGKYPFSQSDTYLLKTTYVFDVSVTELYGWFMGGGRLVVLEPGGEKDPYKILDAIDNAAVTHVNFVPSMFNVFAAAVNPQNIRKLSSLKYIFLAGEALQPGLVHRFKEWNTKILLENLYGPTEGTVYASGYSLSRWEGDGNVPIGKPIENIKLYILDRNDHLQPNGIAGELCISGDGLARGYIDRPELTAEKFDQDFQDYQDDQDEKEKKKRTNKSSFTPLPLYPSTPLYRTGDLARWLPDGNIEFLGRIDRQLKIRGFRIEPGEIENRLLSHNDIKEAVVAATGRTGPENGHLCAYIVSDKIFDTSELREYLLQTSPEYMIPSYFIQLDQFPLTTSGKIDSKALPLPSGERPKLETSYAMPGTWSEKKIADIWKDILGIVKIGIDDSFFELGGNSLDMIKVNDRIQKIFQVDIPVVHMFRYPTIRSLAVYLKNRKTDESFIDKKERIFKAVEKSRSRRREGIPRMRPPQKIGKRLK